MPQWKLGPAPFVEPVSLTFKKSSAQDRTPFAWPSRAIHTGAPRRCAMKKKRGKIFMGENDNDIR
jgi:hypothetical protein